MFNTQELKQFKLLKELFVRHGSWSIPHKATILQKIVSNRKPLIKLLIKFAELNF